MRKLWLQEHGLKTNLNITQPKKQFQTEIDKRVKK